MENLQGGIDWCFVGKGVSGIGGGLLILGAEFTCGVAAVAYAAILATTTMYC